MDLSMELGNVEVIAGLVVLLLIAPLLQFWTLKLGLNGMREDVREIKKVQQQTLAKVEQIKIANAVHDQRLISLESRIKKVEA